MTARTWLPCLCLMALCPPALAGVVPPPDAPAFAVPCVDGKSLLLAQIGGRSGRPEEKPDVTLPGDQKINPKKAMLYSLLIPGLGQQAAGRGERARVFYAIEAGIWTSFAVFRIQGDDRRDRYIDYAEFAAGADASGKDDNYWRTLAQYERSDPGPGSANEFVRRQARALYPDDLAAQQRYFEENGYFGEETWDWQNADNLAKYRELRTKSLDSYDRAELSIFAAIANRVISVIDAARVANQANRAPASGEKERGGNPLQHLGFKLHRDGDDRVPMLTWKTKF